MVQMKTGHWIFGLDYFPKVFFGSTPSRMVRMHFGRSDGHNFDCWDYEGWMVRLVLFQEEVVGNG